MINSRRSIFYHTGIKTMKHTLKKNGYIPYIPSLILILFFICGISGCLSASQGTGSAGSPNPGVTDQTVTITDSLNRTVTLMGYPQRIVAANQVVLDYLILLGAGGSVVGVPEFELENKALMGYLPNATGIGGSVANINCEQIVALKPDLVIAFAKYPPKADALLNSTHIPEVYFNNFDSPDEDDEVLELGRLVGNEKKAEEYVRFTNSSMAAIQSRLSATSGKKPRVYVEYLTDYMTYGGGSRLDRIVTFLHADNIAHNVSADYPTISSEWIIEQDPDIIIKLVSGISLRDNTTTLKDAHSGLVTRPGFSNLSAVRNHRVYVINYDMLSTTRQVPGMLYLAKMFYPAEFSDIDPYAVLNESAYRFQPGIDHISTVYPPVSVLPVAGQAGSG